MLRSDGDGADPPEQDCGRDDELDPAPPVQRLIKRTYGLSDTPRRDA